MAKDPNTPNRVIKLSAAEIEALADRLESRAASQFFDASPDVRSDMKSAASALRGLLCKLRSLNTSISELKSFFTGLSDDGEQPR